MEAQEVQDLIKEQVTTNPVVLYMKGTPRAPMCGFSATAVQILQACNLPLFFSVNVLEDSAIRDGVSVTVNAMQELDELMRTIRRDCE